MTDPIAIELTEAEIAALSLLGVDEGLTAEAKAVAVLRAWLSVPRGIDEMFGIEPARPIVAIPLETTDHDALRVSATTAGESVDEHARRLLLGALATPLDPSLTTQAAVVQRHLIDATAAIGQFHRIAKCLIETIVATPIPPPATTTAPPPVVPPKAADGQPPGPLTYAERRKALRL